MVEFLNGKKTYVIGALMICMTIAKGQSWITPDTYAEVTGILVGLGLWTLRAGVSKS